MALAATFRGRDHRAVTIIESSPARPAWRAAHPAAFVLGWFVLFEVVHIAIAWNGGQLFRAVVPWLPDAWFGPAVWATYTLLAAGLVTALGWWRRIGFTRTGSWALGLRLIAYPAATGAVFLLFGINLAPSQVVPLVLVGAPLIALNEELFFRGVVLEGLRPQGWRWAIIGSAALFGASHAVNIVAGANVPFTIMQIAATTAGGVAFAAIRIRTGSLWPVIVLHVILDVMALSTLTGDAVEMPILIPVLMAWLALNLTLWRYGWRLLRGRSDAGLDASYAGVPAS
jgi:membrane protease YdiL (CAAX protease family)